MTDLLELAGYCEEADGPDRSIDALIAIAVNCRMPGDPAGWPPRYTASLDAALTLVPECDSWTLARLGTGAFCCAISFSDEEVASSISDAKSASLALCAAALCARAALNKDHS